MTRAVTGVLEVTQVLERDGEEWAQCEDHLFSVLLKTLSVLLMYVEV